MKSKNKNSLYHRHRFPDDIIRHAVWLYYRFCLSDRDSVVAESLLLKHQLLILNRSRERAPKLRPADRLIAGLYAAMMRPASLLRT